MTTAARRILLFAGFVFLTSWFSVQYSGPLFGEAVGGEQGGGWALPDWVVAAEPLVKLLGVAGGGLAFLFTAVLAWRRDRRESAELRLKLEEADKQRGCSVLPHFALPSPNRLRFALAASVVFLAATWMLSRYGGDWLGEETVTLPRFGGHRT